MEDDYEDEYEIDSEYEEFSDFMYKEMGLSDDY